MTTTLPVRLILSKAQDADLRRAALIAFPRECCGLLVGHGEADVTVTRLVPAANLADAPEQRFLIDPQVQFDQLRALRGGPERVVGHYHSHPNGRAQLSPHDLAMADDPDAVWLVMAVEEAQGQRRAMPPRAFRCPGGTAPIPIEIAVR